MKLLKRIRLALKVAYHWDRAKDLGAQQKWAAALEHIEAYEKIWGTPLPVDVALLKAIVLYQLKDPVGALRYAIEGHRNAKLSKRRSGDEQRYLECYASVLGLRIMAEQNYTGSHHFMIDYGSINLNKVYGGTKRVFPLRSHPSWPPSR